MKFWKKIYFTVLLLFLVFLNVGIYMVFQVAYHDNLQEEKKRIIGENQVIERALAEDISAFGEKTPGKTMLELVMQDYEKIFLKNGLSFELWQNGICVFPGEGQSLPDGREDNTITIQRKDGIQTACLVTSFDAGKDDYCLITTKKMTELSALWDKLKYIFLILSGVLSLVLAAALYMILRRLTRPLHQLSQMTREVAAGNYERIRIQGKDEIAELGRDFNVMTEAVHNRIESQQRFVANLAHELRTPLTSIGGYSEFLLRGRADQEKQYQALHYIKKESGRMQQMTHQLLLLARVRGEELEFTETNLEDCVKEAYDSCLPLLEEKKLVVDMSGTDFTIQGVPELLVCLVRNLLENAVRACEEGGKIRILWEEGQLRILDDGIGMEAGELEKILEPFYRVDKARSRERGEADWDWPSVRRSSSCTGERSGWRASQEREPKFL